MRVALSSLAALLAVATAAGPPGASALSLLAPGVTFPESLKMADLSSALKCTFKNGGLECSPMPPSPPPTPDYSQALREIQVSLAELRLSMRELRAEVRSLAAKAASTRQPTVTFKGMPEDWSLPQSSSDGLVGDRTTINGIPFGDDIVTVPHDPPRPATKCYAAGNWTVCTTSSLENTGTHVYRNIPSTYKAEGPMMSLSLLDGRADVDAGGEGEAKHDEEQAEAASEQKPPALTPPEQSGLGGMQQEQLRRLRELQQQRMAVAAVLAAPVADDAAPGTAAAERGADAPAPTGTGTVYRRL